MNLSYIWHYDAVVFGKIMVPNQHTHSVYKNEKDMVLHMAFEPPEKTRK